MSRRNRIVPWLMLVGGVALLLLGSAMTSAGMGKVRAEAFMDSWAQGGGEPGAVAWEAVSQAAANAVSFYPVANGEYEDRLGRVFLWHDYRQPFGAPTARESRELALKAFQRSLAARPVAPATHARLAHTYLYLKRLDASFVGHLGQARHQGPWQSDVNRELAEVGLLAWPSLAPAQRAQVMEAFCATLMLPPPQQDPLPELARRAGQSASLCRKGSYLRQG